MSINLTARPYISRRTLVKLLGAGGISLYLQPWSSNLLQAESPGNINEFIRKYGPINRTLGDVSEARFSADQPERAHKILWDQAGFISKLGGRVPRHKESVELAIVGGGISGLLTSYLLKDFNPVILEQGDRFGGNSKGESWRGVDYSIGAAYIIEPEIDSDIYNLLAELGLTKEWRLKPSGDFVAYKGKIEEGLWEGKLDKNNLKQYHSLTEYFSKLNEEAEGFIYPDIPITDPSKANYVKKLDQVSFAEHLASITKAPVSRLLQTAIEQYCWSSFGASASEISAAAGLNFLVSEFSSVAVFPGGNARVAERTLEKLTETLPLDNFRSNSLVFHVEVDSQGVLISYVNLLTEQVHSIHAKKAVLACPKFVVNKILKDIEPDRRQAISKIKYRSYLVANVLLKGNYTKDFYDLYMLGNSDFASANSRQESYAQKVTDVILANYSCDHKNDTVLTLYRPLPYDGARVELYVLDAYQRMRAEFEEQINSSILPLLNIDSKRVIDLRIARWGHPLPVASTGYIADGTTDILRKPFKDKVFFVEQDNLVLPAFETSASEALIWSQAIRKGISSTNSKKVNS